MNDRFFRPVDLLLSRHVPLAIIGGHAVAAHGYPRATQDIDLIFQRTESSELAIAEVLDELNAYWIGDQVDPQTGIEQTFPTDIAYVRRNHLMMLGSDVGYIDLFDFVPGLAGVSVGALIDDVVVIGNRPFVSLKWLRRMKEASGRPQDLADLEHLPPL